MSYKVIETDTQGRKHVLGEGIPTREDAARFMNASAGQGHTNMKIVGDDTDLDIESESKSQMSNPKPATR